ncbi:MAG: hypothetical protein LC808_18930, partial [Actinobacteria bacterium]|nr:hypothetical protein [Actinomycetota bacterium]
MMTLAMVTVGHLTAEQREICRAALGVDLLGEARSLARTTFEVPDQAIALHPDLAANDARHGWLTEPFAELQRALADFRALDLADRRWVGRKLRARAAELLRQATSVEELSLFLCEFDDGSVADVYACWGASLVVGAAYSVLACAEDDANRLLEAQKESAEFADAATSWGGGVAAIASTTRDPSLSAEDIFAVALGEHPLSPIHGWAPGRSFSDYLKRGTAPLRSKQGGVAVVRAKGGASASSEERCSKVAGD